ncbi:sensor histidine kinase [Plesiocystis pacifica SIR-1]|uniref:histidine kinase n=1 Tax=Plesiocystis pacifica SIR-1 TaxID=391625 RepID=A6G573_9BACT|nr:HAMP domain-containing sensor histidine kinase [Plesiocystis pacifica]EDM78985.1 sensor histidine kinase [Plesiocystis pacifica SIR-1]
MRRAHGLIARVLLVSVFGVLFGGTFVFVLATKNAAELASAANLSVDGALQQSRVDACLREPASWRVRGDGQSIYAYDGATLRSANPAAPALDPALVAELRASSDAVVTATRTPPRSGRALARLGPPGPCELFRLEWSAPEANRRRGSSVLVFSLTVVLALASALAIFVAIRPLLARIERLAQRAEQVGDAANFVPIEAPGDDALGRLARQLTHSHERIVTTTDALHARTQALEVHLQDVAHDVRTPLAALQLRLEGLVREAEDPSTRAQLTASIDDVVYLTQLTENLRLASRFEHGLAPSERAQDLGEVLRRVVGRFATLGALHGIKVRGSWPQRPLLATCEPAALEQALANLAHNAIVHTTSEVTLVLDEGEEGFELAVIDDGPGLSPAQLPRLAQRHVSEDDARSRGPSGTGLGLAIVAEVCERFGWTLAFEVLDPPGLAVHIRGPALAAPETSGIDQSHA